MTSDFVHSDVVNATGAASSHAGTPGTPEGAPLPDVIVDVNGQSLAEETFGPVSVLRAGPGDLERHLPRQH